MAHGSREVYRGRRGKRNIAGLLLFILALLILIAAVLFYSFQKYLVYGQSGLTLELPVLAASVPSGDGDGAAEVFPTVSAELVIDPADYSAVPASAGEDLSALRALFVPAEAISAGETGLYQDAMAQYGANALILEVRPESGQLVYPSATETAVSFGLSGSYDLQSLAASLKDAGVYLAAQISCCTDDLLASRNPLVALHNASGGVFADGDGRMWLDPYNATVRAYAAALIGELADMGFDEVLLANAAHPVTDEALVYSVALSSTPTPLAGVSGFALSVTAAAKADGVRIDALLEDDTVHGGGSAGTGQDIALFAKVFDRLCAPADSAWQYEADTGTISPSLTLGDPAQRYLPVMSFAPEDAGSWIVRVPDGVIQGAETETP